MISAVSSVKDNSYMLSSSSITNNPNFSANSFKGNNDRFEKSNSSFGFSKASIWAGITTGLLAFGLMCFSKKFSSKLCKAEAWNLTYIPVPILLGGAVTLLSDLIFNRNSSKGKN